MIDSFFSTLLANYGRSCNPHREFEFYGNLNPSTPSLSTPVPLFGPTAASPTPILPLRNPSQTVFSVTSDSPPSCGIPSGPLSIASTSLYITTAIWICGVLIGEQLVWSVIDLNTKEIHLISDSFRTFCHTHLSLTQHQKSH